MVPLILEPLYILCIVYNNYNYFTKQKLLQRLHISLYVVCCCNYLPKRGLPQQTLKRMKQQEVVIPPKNEGFHNSSLTFFHNLKVVITPQNEGFHN